MPRNYRKSVQKGGRACTNIQDLSAYTNSCNGPKVNLDHAFDSYKMNGGGYNFNANAPIGGLPAVVPYSDCNGTPKLDFANTGQDVNQGVDVSTAQTLKGALFQPHNNMPEYSQVGGRKTRSNKGKKRGARTGVTRSGKRFRTVAKKSVKKVRKTRSNKGKKRKPYGKRTGKTRSGKRFRGWDNNKYDIQDLYDLCFDDNGNIINNFTNKEEGGM